MGRKAQIQRQIDILRVGAPPMPPQLSPSTQGQILELQQKRGERKQLKRQYRTSRRAAHVAAQMIQRGLQQAVGELQAQGLQGPELSQAVREFASRQADAVAAARYHTNAARHDFQKDDQTLAEDIAKGKVEKQAAVSQANQKYSQDVADYNSKVAIAGLEAAKRGASKTPGSGGMTPTQQRAQTEARQAALIGIRDLLHQAPNSQGETPLAVLKRSRSEFIIKAAKYIPQAETNDIAWALNHLSERIRAGQSGNTKALGGIRRKGLGGRRAQAITGG